MKLRQIQNFDHRIVPTAHGEFNFFSHFIINWQIWCWTPFHNNRQLFQYLKNDIKNITYYINYKLNTLNPSASVICLFKAINDLAAAVSLT